jgi:3-deoxy-D-manno-octulosonic-acid transferase
MWIHAVSVGEVQASAVLVRALLKQDPNRQLLVTTGTATGAQRVAALFGSSVQHAFLPYDMPGAVRRFLDRFHPTIGVVMETEIWPNLFRACRERGIPVMLASARLSQRSLRRYSKFRRLTTDALQAVRVEAQSEADAQRFRDIGAVAHHVNVSGNLKFDIEIPNDVRAAGERLRREQFANRVVWLAASTHEGEEEAALRAHELVRAQCADALLLLVPRHPQRFDAVADLLSTARVPFVRRSLGDTVDATTQVILVDTMGELLMLYRAADLAFVGGSLVPIGGHSLLEPAASDCPMVIGPHNFNAPDIATKLIDANAAKVAQSPEKLGDVVLELLKDESQRRSMARSAALILAGNRGALSRIMNRIESLTAQ